jgi:hypothetical protein
MHLFVRLLSMREEPASHIRSTGFSDRWDRITESVDSNVADALSTVDPTGVLQRYCASLGLYRRVPFLVTCMLAGTPNRNAVAVAIGMHIIGMKLLDDVIDQDTSQATASLVCGGLQLLHRAMALLDSIEPGGLNHTFLSKEMAALVSGLNRSKTSPAIDFVQWRRIASTYGGGFLRIYGRLAGHVVGDRRAAELAGRFSYAFGNIITIADDIVDYEKNDERSGNLGELLATGAVSSRVVCEVVMKMRAVCLCSIKTALERDDLAGIVNHYAGDVVDRIIPRHLMLVQ